MNLNNVNISFNLCKFVFLIYNFYLKKILLGINIFSTALRSFNLWDFNSTCILLGTALHRINLLTKLLLQLCQIYKLQSKLSMNSVTQRTWYFSCWKRFPEHLYEWWQTVQDVVWLFPNLHKTIQNFLVLPSDFTFCFEHRVLMWIFFCLCVHCLPSTFAFWPKCSFFNCLLAYISWILIFSLSQFFASGFWA